MIADEPTRLTSVGDSSASSPGSTNCSRMKKANASPTQRREAAQPRHHPDDDGEGDRQHDDRGVPLVVEEAVGRPALGPGVAGEHERVALGDAGRDDLRRQLDLLEVPGALAVEDLHDGGRARSRRRRVGAQSNVLDGDHPRVGIRRARRERDLGGLLRPGRLVARPQHEQPDDGGQADRDEEQQHQPDRPPAAAEGLRAGRRRVGVGTVAVGVAGRHPVRLGAAAPRRRADTGERQAARRMQSLGQRRPSVNRCHRPESCSGRATAAGGRDEDHARSRRGCGHLLQLHQHGHAGGVHEATPPRGAARRGCSGWCAEQQVGQARGPAAGGRPR